MRAGAVRHSGIRGYRHAGAGSARRHAQGHCALHEHVRRYVSSMDHAPIRGGEAERGDGVGREGRGGTGVDWPSH